MSRRRFIYLLKLILSVFTTALLIVVALKYGLKMSPVFKVLFLAAIIISGLINYRIYTNRPNN